MITSAKISLVFLLAPPNRYGLRFNADNRNCFVAVDKTDVCIDVLRFTLFVRSDCCNIEYSRRFALLDYCSDRHRLRPNTYSRDHIEHDQSCGFNAHF